MASIVSDPNGKKRLLICCDDGKRRAVRLGKTDRRNAEVIAHRIELIDSARRNSTLLDDATSRWLIEIDDKMHEKLAAAGLVESRANARGTLGAFIEDYLASIAVKPTTVRNYRQAANYLIKYFGAARPLRSIQPRDCDQWRAWMRDEQKLAQPTISKWVINARLFFKRAVRWGLLAHNPFADVKAGAQTNRDRMHFISREDAQKLIDAAPDAQWRLLIALSRFGGIRCPSESLALTWECIDWERGRVRVPSCKTEHLAGGDERIIPLFPELRGPLMEVFEEAEEGEPAIITRYRESRQNLRTTLCRIIRRAGLAVWPRPFHNLRSSRQSELSEEFPVHVVCAWLGNSPAVAHAHYLQVREQHFDDAARSDEGAAQKTAQQALELSDLQLQSAATPIEMRSQITECASMRDSQRSQQGSNLQPSASEADALSN